MGGLKSLGHEIFGKKKMLGDGLEDDHVDEELECDEENVCAVTIVCCDAQRYA